MTGKTWPPATRFSRLLTVAVVLYAAGCDATGGAPARGEERSALFVKVAAAIPSNEYTVQRDYVGRVEAARSSRLGFELTGTLLDVAVDEGDEIAAGQTVARLDTARLNAALAEAEAMLEQALSARRLATMTLERHAEAAEFGGISDQELDIARDNAERARARAAAAEAGVHSVRVDIAKSELRAPYDAVVVTRHLDEGDTVAPGEPVLDLQERAPAEVRIGVAGDLASSMRPGQTKSLKIDGRDVPATVRAVVPVRDPSTRTVDVILRLSGDSGAVPGDLARLTVEHAVREAGFRLPVDALAEGSHGLWNAYVAVPIEGRPIASNGATHYLEPRALEVLHEATSHVFVRGALAAGDRYVTGGLQRVVPNQEVRVARQRAMGGGSPAGEGS